MCIKSKVFTHHADPAHGWLAVSMADMVEVSLPLSALSRYSYVAGSLLYLEEDCDAAKFFAAFVRTYGHEPSIQERYSAGSSFIRALPGVRS